MRLPCKTPPKLLEAACSPEQFLEPEAKCISCCRVFNHHYLLRSVKQEQQHTSQGTSLFSSPGISLAATRQHRELKMDFCRRMRGCEPADYTSVCKLTCSLEADDAVCLRTGISCCTAPALLTHHSSGSNRCVLFGETEMYFKTLNPWLLVLLRSLLGRRFPHCTSPFLHLNGTAALSAHCNFDFKSIKEYALSSIPMPHRAAECE